MRVLFSPHLSQHSFFLVLLIIGILTSLRLYLIIDSICIILIISEVEHLFMCLLAICMPSLGKCLFRFSAHFKTIIVELCDINLLLDVWFANIFSSLIGCLFVLMMVSFAV